MEEIDKKLVRHYGMNRISLHLGGYTTEKEARKIKRDVLSYDFLTNPDGGNKNKLKNLANNIKNLKWV